MRLCCLICCTGGSQGQTMESRGAGRRSRLSESLRASSRDLVVILVGATGRSPVGVIEMSGQDHYPKRRCLRLAGYDYAECGAYFVTICSHERACLFGQIEDNAMRLSELGKAVEEEFLESFVLRKEVTFDAWVIMPNHVHAVVVISGGGSAYRAGDLPVAPTKVRAARGPARQSVSSLVAGFKAAATRRVRQAIGSASFHLWQRNYHEHVIRNEAELERVRTYIAGNAQLWDQDGENPERTAAARRRSRDAWT